MAAPLLLFQREITSEKVVSATSEGGSRIWQPIQVGTNTGAMGLISRGSPNSVVNGRVEIVGAGDAEDATFKYSTDGGGTAKGRLADTTFDDGASGGAGTSIEIIDDTATVYPSRPVLIDFDLDGIDDRVIIAVARTSTTPHQIDLYYTEDLTGATGWAVMATDVCGGANDTIVSPALLRRGSELFLFVHDTTDDVLYVRKSVNGGGTWGEQATVGAISSSATGTRLDAIVLLSGAIAVVYTNYDTSKQAIRLRTSDDGNSWSDEISVTADVANDYWNPTIVQEMTGKAIVFCTQNNVDGIEAFESTDWDVSTWDDYAETIWAADANDADPSACIAPDGTIYVVWSESSDKIQLSKFKSGDANYSAAADIVNVTNGILFPTIENIGGALWCAMHDGTAYTVDLCMSKYWVAYSANPSWVSIAAKFEQIMPESWFLDFVGSNGRAGDAWTVGSDYIYSRERIIQCRPQRPYRSSADEVDVRIVIDMGANSVLPASLVCVGGNFAACSFQMNDTDSWGSPSVDEAISLVEQTLSSATWGADGTVYKSGAAMPPHKYKGRTLVNATAGTPFLVDDNDSERLYVKGTDFSALTGDAQILGDRAWKSFTSARHRFLSLLIEDQQTLLGVYEVWFMIAGIPVTLSAFHTANRPSVRRSGKVFNLESGGIIRMAQGGTRVDHTLVFNRMSLAEYAAVRAGLEYCENGYVPFILIPDSSNTFDFRLVYGPQDVSWDATQTVLQMEEII